LPHHKEFYITVFVYLCKLGARKAEVLNSLIMKIMAKENNTNDILQMFG